MCNCACIYVVLEGREAEQSGNVRDFPDTEKRGAFASGIFMSTFCSWNNVKLE